jgi:hypothetical protein
MLPEEYYYCFWRVKAWKLTGNLSVDYTSGEQTWEGSSSIDIVYTRPTLEQGLLCLSNVSYQSPFELGVETTSFGGTYTVIVDDEPVSSPMTFGVSCRFSVGWMIGQNELGFAAVGKSQTESTKFSAGIGITFNIGSEGYGAELVSGRTLLGVPEAGPIEEDSVGSMELVIDPEEETPIGRTVPLYPPFGFADGLSISNLKLQPSEWYEYALSGNSALYDSATGAVIGSF